MSVVKGRELTFTKLNAWQKWCESSFSAWLYCDLNIGGSDGFFWKLKEKSIYVLIWGCEKSWVQLDA